MVVLEGMWSLRIQCLFIVSWLLDFVGLTTARFFTRGIDLY